MVSAANDQYDLPDDQPVNLGGAARLLHIVLLVATIIMSALLVILAFFALLFAANGAGLPLALDPQSYSPAACKILAITTAYYMAGVAIVLAVILQLRKIVKTLNSGDPFVPDNASHLRRIWMIIAGGELARTVLEPWVKMSTQKLGDMGLPLDLHMAGEAGLSLDIRLHVWFFVLILIVLAQVFREGARLRAEAQLTV